MRSRGEAEVFIGCVHGVMDTACQPVWPSGKAMAGKRKDLASIPLRLSFLFKKVVVCGHCLVTLSITSY